MIIRGIDISPALIDEKGGDLSASPSGSLHEGIASVVGVLEMHIRTAVTYT
jgi:hypothetical protein